MNINENFVNVAIPARPLVSDRLEEAFLAEMLKHCGPTGVTGGFSGGPGEEQFSSFLTLEYAGLMARKLDLGFSHALMDGAVE